MQVKNTGKSRGKETLEKEGIKGVPFLFAVRFRNSNKNPRICRVNHLFEPNVNVGAWYCRFGYSTYRYRGIAVDTRTADKVGSRFQGVGSKKRMFNHAQRRGLCLLKILPDLFT
jgi:hypothetical protein